MSGKSSNNYSVAVAISSAGSADADANGLPQIPADPAAGQDPTINQFAGVATTRASVEAFAGGAEQFHTEDHGGMSPGAQVLSPIGVVNTTGAEKFNTPENQFFRAFYPDEITFAHRFKTAAGGDPLKYGFGRILSTSMGLHDPGNASPATLTTSADGAGPGGDTFVVLDADATSYLKIGAPVRRRKSGEISHEYAIITQTSSDAGNTTCKVHPAFSSQVMNGEAIELCYAFYPVIGAANVKSQDAFVKFSMGGTGSDASVERIACLSRCSGFAISQDNLGASLSMSIKPGVVVSRDGAEAKTVETKEPPGKLLQMRYGSRMDLAGDHSSQSPGVSLARVEKPNFDYSIEVEFDVAPSSPSTKGLLRSTAAEINGSRATVSITTEGDTELQRMLVGEERRTLVLSMGPSSTAGGQGAAFILSNAGRADGEAAPVSGDEGRIQQTTSLMAIQESNLCDLTGLDAADLHLARAPFMLVLPKSAS